MTDKRTIGVDIRSDSSRARPKRSRKKVCIKCGEKLGFYAFMEFLKDGYTNDVNCDTCYTVNTLERGKTNGIDGVTLLLAMAIFLTFAILPSLAFAIHTMNNSGNFRISAWMIGGGLILGFAAARLCLSLRRWQAAWVSAPIDKTHMRERG